MLRNKKEKERDNLIGEAVLLLIKTNGYVDSCALAARLKTMADEEQVPERKRALLEASEWVRKKSAESVLSEYCRSKSNEQVSRKCLIDRVDNSFQKKH